MRLGLLLLLCLLILMNAGLARAAFTRTVVYVKMAGDTPDAPADVYQQDIPGNEPRLLIAHTALPSAFKGRIDSAQPSVDGRYLLLQESSGVIIRNPVTGATRVALGGYYSFSGAEKVVGHFSGKPWLWERASGKMRTLDVVGMHAQIVSANLRWSPAGHALLGVLKDKRAHKNSLAIYDPLTMHWRILRTVPGDTASSWMPDGKAVLSVEPGKGQARRFIVTPLSGASRLLFTFPHPFTALTVSPNGRRFAMMVKPGILLLDAAGHILHTLKVPLDPDFPCGELAFSPQGETLAILSESTTGEPHVQHHEELWSADINTGKTQRITQWDVIFGSTEGGDPVHTLWDWTADAENLLLIEQPGSHAGLEKEWRKLLRYPIMPGQPTTLLFDSGPYVLDMVCSCK